MQLLSVAPEGARRPSDLRTYWGESSGGTLVYCLGEKIVKSKNLLAFIVFMAVIFLVLVPYVRFVVQRQGLDTDLARISLDYSTVGRVKFEERVDRICRKAGLDPGSYQVNISENMNGKRVSVEIRYEAEFSIFFVSRHEKVVLRNDFSVLDL